MSAMYFLEHQPRNVVMNQIMLHKVFFFHLITAAWLAQLGERRTAVREVEINTGRTNTQGLKIN